MIQWAMFLGLIALLAVMFLYEWPRISKRLKREKIAFVLLTALGAILATLLIFNPEMPGITQWIDNMYAPLIKMMEK